MDRTIRWGAVAAAVVTAGVWGLSALPGGTTDARGDGGHHMRGSAGSRGIQPGAAGHARPGPGADAADGGASGHVHATTPREYAGAHVPASAWTQPGLIARGREVYAARCAACHGVEGDGRGPAGAGLPVKPPDFRDARMVNEMAGNYWFWRVSEGGLVEPFRATGSVMPAWKNELSVEDRWAVVAYQHTFSGHRGPHVTSEHPEMLRNGSRVAATAGRVRRCPSRHHADAVRTLSDRHRGNDDQARDIDHRDRVRVDVRHVGVTPVGADDDAVRPGPGF